MFDKTSGEHEWGKMCFPASLAKQEWQYCSHCTVLTYCHHICECSHWLQQNYSWFTPWREKWATEPHPDSLREVMGVWLGGLVSRGWGGSHKNVLSWEWGEEMIWLFGEKASFMSGDRDVQLSAVFICTKNIFPEYSWIQHGSILGWG